MALMVALTVISQLMQVSHCARQSSRYNFTWPVKRAADVEGDILLGGLMMVHERQDDITCGPIMPQGGIQV